MAGTIRWKIFLIPAKQAASGRKIRLRLAERKSALLFVGNSACPPISPHNCPLFTLGHPKNGARTVNCGTSAPNHATSAPATLTLHNLGLMLYMIPAASPTFSLSRKNAGVSFNKFAIIIFHFCFIKIYRRPSQLIK